jgi:hypothetical protein
MDAGAGSQRIEGPYEVKANRTILLWCTLLLGCSMPAAWSLTQADVAQLVMLDWQAIADITVDRVQWMGDGMTLVFGGTMPASDDCAVGLYGGRRDEAQFLPDAASTRFAISPDGAQICYWRLVPMEEGQAAELAVYAPSGRTTTTVGAPRSRNSAMHLAWLSGRHILFTFQREPDDSGVLFMADLEGGPPTQLLEKQDGWWQGLRSGPGPSVTAEFLSATGLQRDQIHLDSSGQVRVTPLVEAPPSAGTRFELDGDGRLILLHSSTEGQIADEGVRCVAPSPDGRAALYCKSREVAVVSSDDGQPRSVVTVAVDGVQLDGCSWSPGGGYACAWGRRGDRGSVWYGQLGLERVTVTFEFPATSTATVGSRLWVVERFQFDDLGRIVEPDWGTLKALFTVRRVLRGADKTVVEAESIGRQAGVVARMTGSETPSPLEETESHIRIGLDSGDPTQWAHGFRARPLPSLQAWLERTPETGRPLVVTVERQLLLPVDGPQPVSGS